MLTAKLRLPALPVALPARHWPASALLATTFGLYLLAGFSVTSPGGGLGSAFARSVPATSQQLAALPKEPAPVPEPLAFRDMAPQDAVAHNASIPLSGEPNPAARPFVFVPAADSDRLRSLDCLTAAVYYEAAIETTEGQRAVAQVVLNRVRHPAFPKTVCGVVFQGSERSTGCQFTFTCDGALARLPSRDGWARARKVAEEALAGKVYAPVGYATHYHTNWVVPYWSSSLTKLANVGTHIFYRWEGGWGRPPAFRFRHAGAEPQIARLSHLSPAHKGLSEAEQAAALAAADTPTEVMGDLTDRAVVRRYEPLRQAAAANARAELAKPDVPQSLRWALTGERAAAAPPAPAPAPAGAAPVKVELPAAVKSASPADAAAPGKDTPLAWSF